VSPIIDVEPDVFDAASKVLGQKVTSQLTNAVTDLEQALAGTGGMAGTDPGGTTWAASYDHATAVTVGGMTDLTNACYKLAAMLELTGFNHGRAESASDPTHTAPTPADTTRYAAPATLSCDPQPPSAHGGSGSPPRGWGLVEHLVGYVWPNGDPGKLRTAARAWSAAATTLDTASYDIPEALHAIRSQRSPEVDTAATVCQAMMDHIQDAAGACRDLSTACSDYATHIEKAHKDIEDEVVNLLEWTIAIEAAGAVTGFFSFGIGEGAAQAAEAGRIAATASRVASIISRLIELAGTVAARITSVVPKIAEFAQRLKLIRGAPLARATAEEVERLPTLAKDAETTAEESLASDAESAAAKHYRELGMDPATGTFRENEADTALRIESDRNVQLTRSPDKQGPDWIGSDGKTYDAVGPFEARFFDQQWQSLQRQIVRHLGEKADYVPVDVSKFTPEQIAKVKEFIEPLGPRVFLVGE
jgi:hypothetical protein